MATTGIALASNSTFTLASGADCVVQNTQGSDLHVVVTTNPNVPAESDPYHTLRRGESFRKDITAGDTYVRNPMSYPVVVPVTE